MASKPHRNKKLMKKALREANREYTAEKSGSNNSSNNNTHSSTNNNAPANLFELKPFHPETAKEMLSTWKNEVEHIHLKNKPHHHKRTTPGSVDAENPLTISGHSINDKAMKTGLKSDIQKAADMGRKFLRHNHKKAA